MSDVTKLKFENGSYNIKDTTARNEINSLDQKIESNTSLLEGEISSLDQKIESNTHQLESEINNLDEQLAQSTTDVNSYVRTKQQSIPPKQGVTTNSKKLIVKVADKHVRVVQRANKGYVYHDFKSGIGGNSLVDTGGSHELYRLLKSKKVENAYVALTSWESVVGDMTILHTPSQDKIDVESKLMNLEHVSLSVNDNFSNLPNNVGLTMYGLSAPSTESSVTYHVVEGKSKKANVVIGGSSGSTQSAEIHVNGEVVKTFNPTKIKSSNTSFNYQIVEFDIPTGEGGIIEVKIVNKDTTGKALYLSCLNFFPLNEYDGQRIDTYKVLVPSSYNTFIEANGSSDYAFFDVETNKWVGSYHGGEVSNYKIMTWSNSYDKRFDRENRIFFADIDSTNISNGDFFITSTFEMVQQTTLTTTAGKTANMLSRFNFDCDGTINMSFSLFDNTINMSSVYTAMTCAHIDLDMLEFPKVLKLDNVQSVEQVAVSEGYVRQRDTGGITLLDTRYTIFNNTYNTAINPTFIETHPTLYRKLYYAPVVNFEEGVTIPHLTFSKALDFYSR